MVTYIHGVAFSLLSSRTLFAPIAIPFYFPFVLPFTYLAPSSCDRNCPPSYQVACRLTPFAPPFTQSTHPLRIPRTPIAQRLTTTTLGPLRSHYAEQSFLPLSSQFAVLFSLSSSTCVILYIRAKSTFFVKLHKILWTSSNSTPSSPQTSSSCSTPYSYTILLIMFYAMLCTIQVIMFYNIIYTTLFVMFYTLVFPILFAMFYIIHSTQSPSPWSTRNSTLLFSLC